MATNFKLILTIAFIILFFIGAQICRLWKFVVYILSRIIHSQLDEILEARDNFFVIINPNFPRKPKITINSMLELIMDQPINLQQFQNEIYKKILSVQKEANWYDRLFGNPNKLLIYKRLIQYPKYWMGYTFFAWDKNFSITNHITMSTVFVNNPSLTEEDFVKNRLLSPFPPNRPPWEIIVFPNSFDRISTAKIFIRLDHVLGDGLSMLRALCDISSTHKNPPSISIKSNASINFISQFRRLITYLQNEIEQEDSRKKTNTAVSNAIKLEINEEIFVSSTKEFPLDQIKIIKNLRNLSMTEFLANIVRNNLKIVLKSSKGITELLSILYWLVLPDPKGYTAKGFRNQFFEVSTYLNLDSSKLALDQLNNVCIDFLEWRLKQLQHYPNIIQKYIILPTPIFPISGTNIIGPTEPVTLMLQNISKIKFWIPATNPFGLLIQFFSYNNKLIIVCTGNSYLFRNNENFQGFVKTIENELDSTLSAHNSSN